MQKPRTIFPTADPVQADATRFIEEICRKTGCTPTEIARRSGLSPSTITRIYPVPTVRFTLSSRSIAKIKRAFPSFLSHPISAAVQPISAAQEPISPAVEPMLKAEPATGPGHIAVFSLEAGAIGTADSKTIELKEGLGKIEAWSDLSLNPVTHVAWWGDGNDDDDRFFGIYVAGDAMYPRLCPAEIAVVDSVKPVMSNADAFIRLRLVDDSQMVFFARVAERKGSHIVVEFYEQGNKKIEIPRSMIREIFPVIGIITNSF